MKRGIVALFALMMLASCGNNTTAKSDDKVAMKTVDFSTTEGEKIADKYEIASSSLIVVKDGKVDNLTSMGFQYARNNPELFKKSLSESIQKMLK